MRCRIGSLEPFCRFECRPPTRTRSCSAEPLDLIGDGGVVPLRLGDGADELRAFERVIETALASAAVAVSRTGAAPPRLHELAST